MRGLPGTVMVELVNAPAAGPMGSGGSVLVYVVQLACDAAG